MKKILLISPDFNPKDSKTRYLHFRNSGFFDLPITPAKAFMAPLSLATVHALTPKEYHVDIWDEGIHGSITDIAELPHKYDLVGVTGYASHTGRIRELGKFFRDQGILTACGGPDASASPENYRDYFDILFVNEVEYTWPQFLADWENGNPQAEYRQVDKPPMYDSPLPRWDTIAPYMRDYCAAAVQTTRGCPFDCHYCDVVSIYGREPRHKRIEQVLEEVRALQRLGADSVFLCDDNFIGTPNYARELLEALAQVNQEFPRPLGFSTQITLNVTDPQNEDILEGLARANFRNLFVGVETPSEEALREVNKGHNLHSDIGESVKKIQSYGMIVQAGMIVGFDSDDSSIFQRQLKFLQECAIWNPMINTLKAPVGTKLWVKMHEQGRVVHPRNVANHEEQIGSDPLTNIIPAKMTRAELMSGYTDLVQAVRDWDNFFKRGIAWLSQIAVEPKSKNRTWKERKAQMPVFARLLLSWDMRTKKGALYLRLLFEILRRCPTFITEKLFAQIVRQYLASTKVEQSQAEEQSSAFIPFLFSIKPKAAVTILRLLLYTYKERPDMLDQVLGEIGRQYMLAAQIPDLVKVVKEQILWEQEEGVENDPMVFFIPPEFRKVFPSAIFPALHERMRNGLRNKSRTLNALVEVVYDFLTRYAHTFEKFERQHHELLIQFCDRVIASENTSPQGQAYKDAEVEKVPDARLAGLNKGQFAVRIRRLADEVLRDVEKRMRGFQPQELMRT